MKQKLKGTQGKEKQAVSDRLTTFCITARRNNLENPALWPLKTFMERAKDFRMRGLRQSE
ncbi:hypothetical protein E2C01_098929 [Portunus trituberculatus]|uniref:Uncharacterized protein n=1 Tax=Portunus trituberculatus TaxID=210409 RepID=A0A5B7KE40_PORTR|nr:hypothetical protein [Portunus trituberculatus]